MGANERSSPAGNRRPSQQEPQPQQEVMLPRLLKTYEKQIALALPKHMTAERMIRVALTAFNKTPALKECDPLTIAGAIVQAAQLGLEPDGVLGHAYLVPFRNWKRGNRMECQLIPGYKGLLDLARRSGKVLACNAHLVYSYDQFDWVQGLEEKLEHRPLLMRKSAGVWEPVPEEERGDPVLGYATAQLRDGGHALEVMGIHQIHRIRDKSSQAGAVVDHRGNSREATGPWVEHYEWMARKTVLKQMLKLCPLSVEMQTALSLTDANDAGLTQDLEGMIIDASERGPMPQLEAPVASGPAGDPPKPGPAPKANGGAQGANTASTAAPAPTTPAPAATAAQSPTPPDPDPAPQRPAGLSIDDFTADEFGYLQSAFRRTKNFNRAQLTEWLSAFTGDKHQALSEANALLGALDAGGGGN